MQCCGTQRPDLLQVNGLGAPHQQDLVSANRRGERQRRRRPGAATPPPGLSACWPASRATATSRRHVPGLLVHHSQSRQHTLTAVDAATHHLQTQHLHMSGLLRTKHLAATGQSVCMLSALSNGLPVPSLQPVALAVLEVRRGLAMLRAAAAVASPAGLPPNAARRLQPMLQALMAFPQPGHGIGSMEAESDAAADLAGSEAQALAAHLAVACVQVRARLSRSSLEAESGACVREARRSCALAHAPPKRASSSWPSQPHHLHRGCKRPRKFAFLCRCISSCHIAAERLARRDGGVPGTAAAAAGRAGRRGALCSAGGPQQHGRLGGAAPAGGFCRGVARGQGGTGEML